MTTEELRESLLAAPKNGFARITPEQRVEMEAYCKRYMAFMDACKTERKLPLGQSPRLKSTASRHSSPVWLQIPAISSTMTAAARQLLWL